MRSRASPRQLADDAGERLDPSVLLGRVRCGYCRTEFDADYYRCPSCGKRRFERDA